MSLALYDRALHERAVHDRADGDRRSPGVTGLGVRWSDGRREPLPLDRWLGELDGADRALLDRVDGWALDVGCGPGRLTAALARRGVAALGLDLAPAAVRLTRLRGGAALLGNVLGPLPVGEFRHVLLADGNIGIGGDPVRLLGRLAGLLAPQGRVHAEVAPPGTPSGPVRAQLHADGRSGAWFDWARLSADAAPVAARAAGLQVREVWTAQNRWFLDAALPARAGTSRPSPGRRP